MVDDLDVTCPGLPTVVAALLFLRRSNGIAEATFTALPTPAASEPGTKVLKFHIRNKIPAVLKALVDVSRFEQTETFTFSDKEIIIVDESAPGQFPYMRSDTRYTVVDGRPKVETTVQAQIFRTALPGFITKQLRSSVQTKACVVRSTETAAIASLI